VGGYSHEVIFRIVWGGIVPVVNIIMNFSRVDDLDKNFRYISQDFCGVRSGAMDALYVVNASRLIGFGCSIFTYIIIIQQSSVHDIQGNTNTLTILPDTEIICWNIIKYLLTIIYTYK
jgi:hypothetical protein